MTKNEWNRLQFFTDTGQLLYGDRWAGKLAKDLGVTSTTIYNFASQKAHTNIPDAVYQKCVKLLQDRLQAITVRLEQELGKTPI
jgi:hypothetical protein